VKLEKDSVLRGLLTLNTLPASVLAPGERTSPHAASVFTDLPGYPKTGRHEHRAAMRSLQVSVPLIGYSASLPIYPVHCFTGRRRGCGTRGENRVANQTRG
jgi:hypothetical protein